MLPPNIETEKTIFGVKASWVDDKKIKKEYLAKLKKLCDELSLQPIGFMVITEAISHLLTAEEGAPLSAILAEIGKADITLTLFRAGKILEAHSSKIEDSQTKTVDRLLHHFTTDVLPSRILLLNAIESESLAQDFLAHHWSKSIPFLHVPQISVLPVGLDGKAMVYGAGEQMGFSVIEAIGDIKIVNMDSDGKSEITTKEVVKEEAKEEKELPEEKQDEPEGGEASTPKDGSDTDIPMSGENFGFVMDQDISKVAAHKPQVSPHHEITKQETTASSDYVPKSFNDNFRSVPDDTNSEGAEASGSSFLAGITAFIPGLLSKLKLPSVPGTGFK